MDEFQEVHDVSRVVVYICTHGFSSKYGQHLEFYDGDILLDDLLRPLYQCPTLKGDLSPKKIAIIFNTRRPTFDHSPFLPSIQRNQRRFSSVPIFAS